MHKSNKPPRNRSPASLLAGVGFVAFALLAAGRLPGAVYDYAVNDGSGRALRLNIPDDLTTVRGVLSWGNGGVSDSRAQATNAEFVTFARAHGFCVLATAGFAFYTPDAYQVYLTGIERLAAMSGHAELTQVPWLPWGHSNGGIMSFDLSVADPGRTIAFAVTKASGFTSNRPGSAILATPGLCVAGELDTAIRVTGIRDLFEGNRPRGGLWAWVEEDGIGHDSAGEDDLIRPFSEEILNLRYPDSQDSRDRSLRPVNEASGWLVEPLSFKEGWARIYAYADYPGDRRTASWLPSRRIAYIYRALASYHKVATATLSSGAGPIDWGTAITYTISPPTAPWTAVEFYEGDVLLKRVSSASGDTLAVEQTLVSAGYSVFHAVVTLADGTQRTTSPRRVLVRAEPPPPAPPTVTTQPQGQTVTAGTNAIFTLVAGGYPAPAYQWQRLPAGSLTWENLREGGSYHGTATATLTVTTPPAAMSGDQFRCVTSNSAGSSMSSAVALTVTGGASALFQYPASIAMDGSGNLYVADASSNMIRKITPAGQVSTLAGSNGMAGSQDGTGESARFNQPNGVTTDAAGNLYVADTGNGTIRRITPAGTVTTLAGAADSRGNRDDLGNAASFGSPSGIAVDAAGNLYVADAFNATIRKVAPNGLVSTLAGSAGNRGDADGTGSAARFNFPNGVAVDTAGNVYVADTYNSTIRKITPVGEVITLAGLAGVSGAADGTGFHALLNQPYGVDVDAAGNVYVADTGNDTIRRITPGGAVATLAGVSGIAGPDNGVGSGALFNQPRGLVADAGNVYVADTGNATLRLVTPAGAVSTLTMIAAPSGSTPTPPPSGGTPLPSGSGSTGGGGGGGGGAIEPWFLFVLTLLSVARMWSKLATRTV